ncbi:hypothetical protein, partial [Pseudomonas aeruginosa]|uniref:hypothetical protein n=1 Tax=Pseudomonas aeruginosa TaxID=287 RepID=UPI003002F47D
MFARFSSLADRLSLVRPARAATWVVAVNAALAVLPLLAPRSPAAAISYLVGFSLTVAVLWAVACCTSPDRRTWQHVAAAATCWLLGDLVQRFTRSGEWVFNGAG